jgi:signal transduction histidine kinase
MARRPKLPSWARTVRVRLTVTYSSLVFGIGAVLLSGVYIALSRTLEAEPLDSVALEKFYVSDSGKVKFRTDEASKDGHLVSAADLDLIQAAVNDGTLSTLRIYSFAGLAGLFLISLLVGWWVSGRALRPVEAITSTTREISGSDLSRRIGATGPRDELRTLADTIDDMLARLESEFAAQRALVGEVSHELRNPVAVIQANVDAVLADEDATPDLRRRSAAVISQATAGMTRLLEDLLAVARQRSSAFAEAEVELGTTTRRAVEEYRLLAEERGIRVETRVDGNGPLVYADELALTRVLRNLLANAVRYSPDGGELTVAVGSRQGWAWVAVRDEGPGIAAGEQDRVFERYYSTRDEATDRHEEQRNADGRNGIGLAIARQIVESHDGRIAVFSRPGSGSTFVVWLPDRTAAARGERGASVPDEDPIGRR